MMTHASADVPARIVLIDASAHTHTSFKLLHAAEAAGGRAAAGTGLGGGGEF